MRQQANSDLWDNYKITYKVSEKDTSTVVFIHKEEKRGWKFFLFFFVHVVVVQREKLSKCAHSVQCIVNYDESCSEKRSRRALAVSCTSHWRRTCSLAGSSVGHRCSKLHLAGDNSHMHQRLTYSKYCHLDTGFVRQDRQHSSMQAAFCWEG